MKNREVVNFYNNLSSDLLGSLKGSKLLYALDKNLSRLETEVKSFENARKASKEYKKYDEERIKVNEKYAEKKGGEPKKQPTGGGGFRYVIDDERQQEYDQAMEALNKKHEKAIDDRKKQLDEWEDVLMEAESDFKIHYIELEDLPADIEWKQYSLIRELVRKEDEPEDTEEQKK